MNNIEINPINKELETLTCLNNAPKVALIALAQVLAEELIVISSETVVDYAWTRDYPKIKRVVNMINDAYPIKMEYVYAVCRNIHNFRCGIINPRTRNLNNDGTWGDIMFSITTALSPEDAEAIEKAEVAYRSSYKAIRKFILSVK